MTAIGLGLWVGKNRKSSHWTPPSGLKAVVVSDTAIDLTWKSGKLAVIKRSTDGITYTQIGTGTDSYSDTGLTAGILYYYKVNDGHDSNFTWAVTEIAVMRDSDTVAFFDNAYLPSITKDGNNKISQIADKLGSGHDLKAATAQPEWSPDGWILTSDTFIKTDDFTFNQPCYVYLVCKVKSWTNFKILVGGNLLGPQSCLIQYSNRSGYDVSPSLSQYAGAATDGTNDFPLDTWAIVRALFNGASSKMAIESLAEVVTNPGATNFGGIQFGTNPAAVSPFAQFKDALFRKITDAANETNIYNYFRAKHKRVIILGDSTIAERTSPLSNAVNVYFNADGKYLVKDQSTSGYTIAMGQADYLSLPAWERTDVDFIFIHLGINDVHTNGEVYADVKTRYQTLLTYIKTNSPSAKIICSCILKARGFLETQGDTEAWNKSVALNADILSKNFTGIDLSTNVASEALSDASGYLLTAYERTNDHVHENSAGKEVIANSWRALIG